MKTRNMRPPCAGSGGFISTVNRITVRSYESVDGKPHEFTNCPDCGKQLKAPNDYVVRHVAD